MKEYYRGVTTSFKDVTPRETPGKPHLVKYRATEQHEHTPPEQKKRYQQDTGSVNWYASVALEVKVALSKLQSQTEAPTVETVPSIDFLQGYLLAYGNHEITPRASLVSETHSTLR